MNNYKAFYDLNIAINEQDVTRLRDICDTLVTYGYKTVALNYEIEDLGSDTKKKKKKKGEIREVTDIVPEPLEISALVKEFGDKLTLVHRLTFPFSDQQQFHMLNQSKNLKKYKILAAVPKTQSAFQNVIISSGARESKYIRGPYDIVNLGLIFGLSEEQTKKAVSSTCRSLLTHADGRRCGKIIACIQSDTSPGRSNEVSITNICDQEVNMDEEDLGPTQKKMKQ
ncbi:uncharacterized protein LOC126237033 isoform X2 [Schistocerca nitens]|uniref:uncharacterized protein LOC126237033 isoform X2 n=1 Tax=Schistocerca nitens TaxID=7011 RepID=UPI0021187129|nr:uncharacterized protein LOC126237033 isoform X2 [Schistocerca nitens]